MEVWKTIPQWPTYEVSDLGRIRRVSGGRWNKPGKILKAGDRGKGYLRVMLRMNGKDRTAFVHCLVAEAFHGPRPSTNHEAAHLDGNKSNNGLKNIDWVTTQTNHEHKKLHGTVARGEKVGVSKLTEQSVREIREYDWKWGDNKTLAEKYGVCICTISLIRNNKQWRHVAA